MVTIKLILTQAVSCAYQINWWIFIPIFLTFLDYNPQFYPVILSISVNNNESGYDIK